MVTGLYRPWITIISTRRVIDANAVHVWTWVRSYAPGTKPKIQTQLPPRPTVDEAEIEESFLKGSGPGGQKIVSDFHSAKTNLCS